MSMQESGGLFRSGQFVCQECGKKSTRPKYVMIGGDEPRVEYCECGGRLTQGGAKK